MQNEVQDKYVDTDGEIFPMIGHKIGGKAVLDFNFKEKLIEYTYEKIEEYNLNLFFQMTFPRREDTSIKGNWPFMQGTFFLFISKNSERFTYSYLWG